MHFTITYDRGDSARDSGPISVGWLRATDQQGVLYGPPERVSFRGSNREHSNSAARCPAVVQLESRYFLIRCPFDIHIGFGRNEKGAAVLLNRAGPGGPVRPNKLSQSLTLVNEAEWRYADRPTIQLKLPYVFIADEPVYITQLGPFAHYRPDPLPGTIFGGRFPIDIWPRPLMWAFEWHEPKKDIVLKRGDPLFYCQFEGDGPERPIQLVEAERTPEFQAYMDHIGGAVNYVNQTFSLFKAAQAARPEKLLKPKK